MLNLLSKLCDFKTQCRILAERSFLKTLGGGCSAPVGCNSVYVENTNAINKEFTLKVDGAVWSLNGKTEIVDQVTSDFVVENGKNKADDDDDSLDVSPSKRQRLSNETADGSPEVIDESACSTKGEKNATELMNIHGKIFDVCPYSGQSKSSKNDTTPEVGAGDCPFDPINMPIGQDFMGECPVLNTEQKITYDGSTDGLICPIAGKSVTANMTAEGIEKCPFIMKQKDGTVELIDYEANAKSNPKPTPRSLIEDIEDVKLYCGIYCHEIALKPIFDKCEELGVTLAKKLISAGALEVMKVAQDEIHSKC